MQKVYIICEWQIQRGRPWCISPKFGTNYPQINFREEILDLLLLSNVIAPTLTQTFLICGWIVGLLSNFKKVNDGYKVRCLYPGVLSAFIWIKHISKLFPPCVLQVVQAIVPFSRPKFIDLALKIQTEQTHKTRRDTRTSTRTCVKIGINRYLLWSQMYPKDYLGIFDRILRPDPIIIEWRMHWRLLAVNFVSRHSISWSIGNGFPKSCILKSNVVDKSNWIFVLYLFFACAGVVVLKSYQWLKSLGPLFI